MSEEQDRLSFIEQRDGHDAMLKFAEQGLALYVKASVDRGPYKDSIREYVEVLQKAGRKVTLVEVKP